MTFTKEGITLYVSGGKKTFANAKGQLNGEVVSNATAFDYDLVMKHLAASQYLYLGYGGFWGSADARYDDVIVYDRALSFAETLALSTMENRVFDFWNLNPTGIEPLSSTIGRSEGAVYDLQGRIMKKGKSPESNLPKGIYVIEGKKVVVK